MSRGGITRAETVVLLSILFLLSLIILIGVVELRVGAQLTETQKRLKNLAFATIEAEQSRKKLPPGYGLYGSRTRGVLHHLLPFMEDDGHDDPQAWRYKAWIYTSLTDHTVGDGLITTDGQKYGAGSFGWNDACSLLRL